MIHSVRRNKSRLSIAWTLFFWAVCAAAQADIYQFTDEQGTPNFSNVPSDERYRLLMRTESVSLPASREPPLRFNRANLEKYTPTIARIAADNHLDAALLHAVITVESGYNTRAVSQKGAQGLMQLMPETARREGVTDAFNPTQNIQAGARHLANLLRQFDNNLPLVLAAYNAGVGSVAKYGGHIPPFSETKHYVFRVMEWYHKYQHADA